MREWTKLTIQGGKRLIEKKKAPKLRFPGFTDDWEQRKLEDIVEFLDTMRKPLEGAKRISGPYPYYGASGIVDYVENYIFDEELVLLSEDGANITDRNYPICFLAAGKYWVNNHAHVLKAKPGNENNFICNSLERKDYKQYNTGMAMPKLNQDVCRRIPVSCPSYEEQKKIGNYFRDLDHLITLHQRKLEHTKDLKKSMLQKMFPKKGEKNPEIRFPGFTDDWEQRKLGEVVSLRGRIGFRGYKESDLVAPGDGAITFSPADIDEMGNVSTENNKYLSWTKYDESPEIQVDVGDILFTKTASIGKIGYIKDLKEKATINPQFALLTPKENSNGYFTFLSVRSVSFMKQVRGITGGSSVPTMSQEKLKELVFMSPSLDEQQKIGEYFSNLDHLITLHQRELEHLKLLKKGLLQQMFV